MISTFLVFILCIITERVSYLSKITWYEFSNNVKNVNLDWPTSMLNSQNELKYQKAEVAIIEKGA